MTAAALLSECAALGISVQLAPDDPTALDVSGPDDAMTDDLLGRLRDAKPQLLHLLRQEAAACRAVGRSFAGGALPPGWTARQVPAPWSLTVLERKP